MWKRVIAPTVFVCLIWISVSGGTSLYLNWLCDAHARILSDNVVSIQAAAGMQDVLWQLQVVVMEAAETGRSDRLDEIVELETSFERHWADAEKSSFTPEEDVLVETIRQQFSLYREQVRRKLESLTAPPPSSSLPGDETMTMARAVAQPCKQFLEINERLLAESSSQSAQITGTVVFIRSLALIAGPLLGIVFGILVARGLHRSVSQISVTLKDAAGELNQEVGLVELSSTGDLPALRQQVEVVSGQIKRVVEQLHRARREAIRAERLAAVGELAAGVAHELRNPLTAVKLLIQTASQRYPNRPLNERQLHVVQQEITRMENTIQGLLDFARPPQLNRVEHDLRGTLRRALNLVQGRARQQNVQILEQFPRGPVPVDGDPEQLHQVFVNLLLNGIESMTAGGYLSVAISGDEHGHGFCRVVFADSGSGIPADVLDRIFEPFVTSKQQGTGLGLAVSRRIVQEHHGTLSASNRPEGGALFAVELPLAAAQRAAASTAAPLDDAVVHVRYPQTLTESDDAQSASD